MNFRVKVSTVALVLLFYLAFSGLSFAGGYGQASVKKWADDRKSAFSFTFDDASMSQYTYAAPILDSFKFKGSFFIITSVLTDSLPGNWIYGTRSEEHTSELQSRQYLVCR